MRSGTTKRILKRSRKSWYTKVKRWLAKFINNFKKQRI